MTKAALLLVDLQMEMRERLDRGQDHVGGAAPAVAGRLAEGFRRAGLPVVHVRHRAGDPADSLHPQASGFPPLPEAAELPGEAVFFKSGSSAFVGTGLEAHLRAAGIERLVVAGAVAGFCVASAVRSASDLGFRVTLARDGVLGFGLPAFGGSPALSARTIFDVTMGLLGADFAEISDSAAILARLEPAG